MNKLILLITLVLFSFSYAYSTSENKNTAETKTLYGIEDGWYEATVRYYNSSTYTRSTYTLNVKVINDRVTVIDFGNGGSVHSGYNNSGYLYTGGTLYFQRNYSTGEITSATTKVTITEGSTMITLDISI